MKTNILKKSIVINDYFNDYFLKWWNIYPFEKMDVEYCDPKNFFTPNRFDLAIKLFYIECREKNRYFDIAKELYIEHIKTITGNTLIEPGSEFKNNIDVFLSSFNDTIDSIKNNGFDLSKSVVPVGNGGTLLNGSHRVAACIFYDVKVPIIRIDKKAHYDYIDFSTAGMSETYLDIASLLYSRYSRNSSFVMLFSNSKCFSKMFEEATQEMQSVFKIIYKKSKSINLTEALFLLNCIKGSEYTFFNNNSYNLEKFLKRKQTDNICVNYMGFMIDNNCFNCNQIIDFIKKRRFFKRYGVYVLSGQNVIEKLIKCFFCNDDEVNALNDIEHCFNDPDFFSSSAFNNRLYFQQNINIAFSCKQKKQAIKRLRTSPLSFLKKGKNIVSTFIKQFFLKNIILDDFRNYFNGLCSYSFFCDERIEKIICNEERCETIGIIFLDEKDALKFSKLVCPFSRHSNTMYVFLNHKKVKLNVFYEKNNITYSQWFSTIIEHSTDINGFRYIDKQDYVMFFLYDILCLQKRNLTFADYEILSKYGYTNKDRASLERLLESHLKQFK